MISLRRWTHGPHAVLPLHSTLAATLLLVGTPACEKKEAAPVVDVAAQIKALESAADDDARINAMGELQKAGPAAAPAVPKLIAMLSEADPIVKRMAAFALEAIGPAAREAKPALEAALNGAEPGLMFALNRAISAVDAKPKK